MWITSAVNLPDSVLRAYESGRLVFFVGAGASIPEPSNLPSFSGLSEEIRGVASYRQVKKDEGLDSYLGKLESEPQPFDVHAHVQERMSAPRSTHNSIHAAIVELAAMGHVFRVVTTNYDQHLSAAAKELSIGIDETWFAPALPVGRNFRGLVHLHGSVLRQKQDLVITDRDFGRAYLTDAWAARFLLSMFAEFTVVFIGYSHDDVIMRYLALGLPSAGEAERFAFTNSDNDEKWRYLGIEPIAYPAVGKDHSALEEALTIWAQRVKMGRADHRSRVMEIVAGGPRIAPPEQDYLHVRLRTEEGARDFTDAVEQLADETKVDWLSWVEEIPEFRALFAATTPSDGAAGLGNWFAQTFVASKNLNWAAMRTVQRFRQAMSPGLYRSVCEAAERLASEDAAAGFRWQTILATSIRGCSINEDLAVAFTHVPDRHPCPLPLLRALLKPFLSLCQPGALQGEVLLTTLPTVNVDWVISAQSLREQILVNVGAAAPGELGLLDVLESGVLEAYELLDAYSGESHFDSLAFHRSAIEPHEQNTLHNALDSVIDGLREFGAKAIEVCPGLAERWFNLDRPLFQRLALHLVAISTSLSPDQKLEWLLERVNLYQPFTKHEVFRVLAVALPQAGMESKNEVLAAVAKGPEGVESLKEDERSLAYVQYNLLAWLTGCDPEWTEASKAFKVIQAAHSDFQVRAHPDLDRYMEGGFRGIKLPMEVEDLAQRAELDPAAAWDALLEADYSERNFDQPRWDDLLKLLRLFGEQQPHLAVGLWDKIDGHAQTPVNREQCRASLIDGWSKADLAADALPVLERLRGALAEPILAPAVGEFLQEQITRQINSPESAISAGMRQIAKELWQLHGSEYRHGDVKPLSFAPLYLNSWPGSLALYWAMEVDRRWRHSQEDSGLSEEESSALIALLGGSIHALDAIQPAIAAQLFFYFAADESFAMEHVLPIFSDEQRSSFAWYSFLHHPRVNDRLLGAGLLEAIVFEFNKLAELPDKSIRTAFLNLVISVVSYAGISDEDRRRILDCSIVVDNGLHAADFAQEVGNFLRSEGVRQSEIWDRWLGGHIRSRLCGHPRQATEEELQKWADIVPFAGESIEEAVAVFGDHEIALDQDSLILDIPSEALSVHGEALVGFFAQRVEATSIRERSLLFELEQLVAVVTDMLGEEAAKPLKDAVEDSSMGSSALDAVEFRLNV